MRIGIGRFFVHEHQKSASSCALPGIVGLAMAAGVDTTACDMCAYGMGAEDQEGVAPAEKCMRLIAMRLKS